METGDERDSARDEATITYFNNLGSLCFGDFKLPSIQLFLDLEIQTTQQPPRFMRLNWF